MATDKLKPWTTKQQRVVLETPWFKIRQQEMLTSNGSEATFYIHENSDSVICVCVDGQGKVLVEKQYRPSVEKVSTDYPAGRVEDTDESTETAIRRELQEEAGFVAETLTKLAVIDKDPGWSQARMHVYLARGVIGAEPEPDANESIVTSWHTREDILHMLASGEISCAFCISATLLAFQALGWPLTPADRP